MASKNRIHENRAHLAYQFLLLLIAGCGSVGGACTPDTVKDGLHRCLQYQNVATYFQFPVSVLSGQYSDLCGNVTCMSYCFEATIQACSSSAHVTHLDSGKALKAAYVGFCQLEPNATAALTCGVNVPSQTAIDLIGSYQNDLQTLATNTDQIVDTATVCSNWTTLLTTLETRTDAACSADSVAADHWRHFLRTLMYPCDATAWSTWYVAYQGMRTTVCAAGAISQLNIAHYVGILVVTTVDWTSGIGFISR